MEKQSTAKGFSLLGIAGITSKFLAVLYVPILTLILGNIGNGIYNAGYMMYLLVFVVTNSGIPVAISKLVSEQLALEDYSASYRTLKTSGALLLVVGSLMSIMTAVFAKQFAELIHWPEAHMTILALSPTMFFTAISCTFRGYFQGRSNMKPTSISQVVEQGVNSVLTIVFAYVMFQYGTHVAEAAGILNTDEMKLVAVKYAAAGGTVGTSVGAFISAIYLTITFIRSREQIRYEIEEYQWVSNSEYTYWNIFKKIILYATPITIGQIAIYSASLIDLRFIKERLVTGGLSVNEASAMFGVFSTQYQKILFIPLALSTALSVAIIPGISGAAARGDLRELKKKIIGSLRTILMITVPASVGMAVLSVPIVHMMFPRNPQGADLLLMGSWVLIPTALVSTQTAILQAIGKTYTPTKHLLFGLVIKIVTNYTLVAIPFINIKGAVLGSAACFCFTSYLNYRAITHEMGFRIPQGKLLRGPLVLSGLMGAVAFGTYKIFFVLMNFVTDIVFFQYVISGLLGVLSGALIYFFLMVFTHGIRREDLREFPMGGRIEKIAERLPIL